MEQNFSAALTVDEVGKVAPPEPLSAGKKAGFSPPPSRKAATDVRAHSRWFDHL